MQTRRKDKEYTEYICRECEKTVHGLFTNTELRDPGLELDTLDGLRRNERFQKALKHIRKIPPGEFMKMKDAKRKR